MQTEDRNRVSAARQSKQEKDDAYTPVYKTEKFKENIKKIKQGQPVVPERDDFALRHPDFKIAPPPPPNAGGYTTYLNRVRPGATHDPKKYEKHLTEEVRKQVIAQQPLGVINKLFMGEDKYNKLIEKETKRLVDIIKRPRYIMLSDGTPFYASKNDERDDLEAALVGESAFKRVWSLAKFDVAAGVEKIGDFINLGAMKTKEYVTDINSKGNVAGAVAQLGLNSAMLGWQYLRAADQSMFASEAKADALAKQAEALKYTDPTQAAEVQKQAEAMLKGVQLKKQYQESLQLAGRAVDSAWASLFTEWKEAVVSDKEARAALGPGATPDQIMQYEREQRYKAEAAAREEAVAFRTQAGQAYAAGDAEKAIELIEQAQERDRNSQLADPYGAYTWIREPDRYAKFKRDAALVELQTGQPLSTEMLRSLKEHHQNSWTEMTGELAFDPVNLIPAAILEKVFVVPGKGLKTVGRAAMEIPGVTPVITQAMRPVRWLLRESVTSGANRIARQSYNIMERVSNGYTSAEEVTKAVDEISNVVMDATRAANEQESRRIFEAGRQNIPGLQNITYSDFKQLVDAGSHIDPTQWGKMYSDALTLAETNLMDVAKRSGKSVDEVLSEQSMSRWALEDFSHKFYDAFKDPHRIFKGSRLTDDTVAGWITKKMRAMSGDDINEAMRLTKNDEWLIAHSEKMGTRMKPTLQTATHFVEATLGFAAQMRDFWASAVLTTFRWPINNLADTSMRSLVYGGDLWDDLVTLFTSTQRTLADELGISPIEFNQALSRQELKFTQTVPHRLLYEGWKPKAGLFSYFGYEYKRLLTEHGDKAVAKVKTMENVLGALPNGQLKSALASIYDGMNYRVNLLTAIRAAPGAVSDFNTAIEFTFRLRMFHKEYFKLLKQIEPRFAEQGMEALSPATREIAKQIWRAAEGNPRKMTAYVDNLLGAKNVPAKWSFTVPPELDDILKGMDATDQHLFISSVKNELDEFIETSARTGKEITDADFKKFFSDYKLKMQDEIQERLSAAHDHEDLDMGIRTDGQANNIPDEDDIQGSMPTGKTESPRNKKIEDAISSLNRRGKKKSTIDIHNDFETAISEYATVERVKGDGVKVTKKDGKLIVQVGDNALKQKSGKFYNDINSAVIGILKHQDADTIKINFSSLDEYDVVMRKFFDDPTAVLAETEEKFLVLVNQMENHPTLRTIIEQTSPKTVRSYDSALDVYRDLGDYSDSYGFIKRPDEMFESEAQRKRPIPGSHIAAVSNNSTVRHRLFEVGKTLDDEMNMRVRTVLDNFVTYRQELKQFYSFTYPGPLMHATTEAGRHSGWDLYYRLSEAEFVKEAELQTKLIELIQKDPEAAAKFLDEINNDFGTWFLEQNGIALEWDADKQIILNMKVKGLDGKVRNFTARRDIANLQIRFFSPQAKRAITENPYLRVMSDADVPLQRQMRNALRDTFQLPTAKADAWAKAIDNHAQKWAQETGQPIEKYYERLGFQRVDSSSAKGLGTLEQVREVKRGAVGRTGGGSFMFFGLSHSNFESMVRETSELFFDDLISMAEHSPQAADDLKNLKAFLEEKTGKKIRANKLQIEHSDILSDVFTRYVATGHGPNIAVKGGFDRLKAWLTQTYDAVRDTKVAGEINDEIYRVLDRMFIETKLQAVPKTNARTIKQMAKDADLMAQEEDDLLKIINDAVAKEAAPKELIITPQGTSTGLIDRIGEDRFNQAWNDFASYLTAKMKGAEEDLKIAKENLHVQMSGLVESGEAAPKPVNLSLDDVAFDNNFLMWSEDFIEKHGITYQDFADFLQSTDPAMAGKFRDNYNEMLQMGDEPAQTYTTLGDVPKDVAARILGTQESQAAKELNEAWEVWKTQRGLVGFPDDALADADTFKTYLKTRMGEEWSEASNAYNRMLWEVEQFENAMLNFHAGDDITATVFPRVHEAQISNGMKTFIRNQEKMISNYEQARRALDTWGDYLAKMSKDGHPVALLTKDEQAALKGWAYGDGSKAKAEMIDRILHGNADEGIEGAIDRVNRVMLDYQHTNVTDQFMKNFFPFWMFPSRSFPFWAETIATHPQLIAAYEKVQAMSRSQRYQAGAVTSQGKPLPSLDGYIQIPGTDMWFNPLAPFSFRYLLDIQKSKDNILYAAQSEDDLDPKAYLANEMMSTGQIYGFTMSPWMAWLFKKQLSIPDEVMPRYPLIPEIQMVPRWMVQEVIQRANQMNFFGWKGLGDAIYPEVPWHDYMVERRILENALQQIQSGKLSEADKLKLMNQSEAAIKNKGNNTLWKQTYKDVTSEEATRSIASFFSGLYVKNFGDGQADLLALRNEINLLKSSLNNEFQAEVFDLPVDAETAWTHYLNVQDTSEGWVHRLYTDIGWVRNDQGELIRDPVERAKWLALTIQNNEQQQMYYDKMADLQKEFDKRLRALPIGADWEQSKIVYEWYSTQRNSLDYLRTQEKYYGTNKPVELIQQDMAKDWFQAVNGMKPRWNVQGGESYDEYQQRVMEWELNLPKMAPILMRAYMRRKDLVTTVNNLHEDQQFNTGQFFNELVAMTTKEGLDAWGKENDDIFDALNKAWKATYWDTYWNSVIGKSGYEVDLAEKDFYSQHPAPPSADELYQWIATHYGPNKFTPAEIKKYVDGTDELDITQRQLQKQADPADYTKRQEIWDLLSWVGPGNKNRGVFDQAFANAGGDPDWLTTWYQEGGQAYKTKPERLEQLHGAVQEAIKAMGLKPPARAELVRYVQAQSENERFQQFVTAELGNQFFDYTDEDGAVQQGVYSYYNSLNYEGKKDFRGSYPEEYGAIENYYAMKEAFSEDHPVWADYYGFDTEPSVKLPTQQNTGSVLTPPPLRGTRKGSGGGGGGAQYRPTQSTFQQDYPSFNIYDRTSNYISPGLYQLLGNKMAYEITSLYSSGRKISSAGVSFLRSVKSRYPNYASEIDRILSKGT